MTDAISSTRYLLLILAASSLICLNSQPVQARLIEKVVATVNGEVITQTELDEAGKSIFSQLRQNTPAAELEATLGKARQRVLGELINNLLVSQKAKELRITISEEELDSAIEKIGGENDMTPADLYRELEKTGVSREQYRQKLANQILHSKLVSYEVRSRIVISDEKAREYYDNVYTKQQTAAGYHLLQIGLTWGAPNSSSDTQEKTRQKAEGLRKLAVAGQSFGELARSFSELPSAKDGGDIGFFSLDELAENLREVITELKPGQISPIIETGNSYQFYRLTAKNINNTPEFAPFEDVREEIIDLLRKEELDERYKTWLKEIKDQAIIKELI